MPSLNRLISDLTPEKMYQFQTTLLHHLYNREWCESKGLDYNNLPIEYVRIAKWATYREVTSAK